jgi:Icc protein
VTDDAGRADTEVIEPVSRSFVPPPAHAHPGSDAFRLPAWPEKGLRGDQLGPNRNGRDW